MLIHQCIWIQSCSSEVKIFFGISLSWHKRFNLFCILYTNVCIVFHQRIKPQFGPIFLPLGPSLGLFYLSFQLNLKLVEALPFILNKMILQIHHWGIEKILVDDVLHHFIGFFLRVEILFYFWLLLSPKILLAFLTTYRWQVCPCSMYVSPCGCDHTRTEYIVCVWLVQRIPALNAI